MSRAYRAKISLAELCVLESRRVGITLDLLPILTPERMRAIALEVLAEKGAERETLPDGGERWVLRRPNGVAYRIDPETLTVEVSLDDMVGRTISITVYEEALERSKLAAAQRGELTLTPEEARGLGWTAEQLAELADRERLEARRQLLVETEEARRTMNQMLKDIYREAVKEKARSLGDVTSISESERDGTYRIRIELG